MRGIGVRMWLILYAPQGGYCLHTAGVGGSNPLTPTIYLSNYAILVELCLFWFFSVLKLSPSLVIRRLKI